MKIIKYTIVTYVCGNSRKFGPFDPILRVCPFCGCSATSAETVEEVK